MAATDVLIFCTPNDLKHIVRLKKFFPPPYNAKIIQKDITLLSQVDDICKKVGTKKVATTSVKILQKLVRRHDPEAKADKATNVGKHGYQGSLFTLDSGVDILILPPCEVLWYETGAEWIHSRWLQKLTNPQFPKFPVLDWTLLNHDNVDKFLEIGKQAIMIGIDIETKQQPVNPELIKGNPTEYEGIWLQWRKDSKQKLKPVMPIITMVGYTFILQNPDGTLGSVTGVLLINSMTDVYYMRQFNYLAAPKVMQNGKYDCTYFLRYNAPVYNYLYDTFIAMHAWVAELRRDLGFITTLFDKNSIYWKDEADRKKPEYCAKDVHNTTWDMIYILQQMPEWAMQNYFENFRMVFPCINCGLEGFLVDPKERERKRAERLIKRDELKLRLQKIVHPLFNPNSPKQTLTLMKGLGAKRIKKADDKALKKFKEIGPLHALIGDLIIKYKKDAKAINQYFDALTFSQRILYELDPAGTETGRFASKKSNFWCGTQIQNQPPYTKSMLVSDPGWYLFSLDNKQSESRCTAYISEDRNLMHVVELPQDFHKSNCTMFFGVKYEEVTKDIRDTGKRVNHGANYNMGPGVLLETMGTKAVALAKRLLGLPGSMSLWDVCEYLLACFDKAYPDVRGKYYREVIQEIQTTGMLVGATGWTRKCFGNPANSKPELNSYVAHAPQSLSVKMINAAFFDVWLRLQIKENKVRFKAQIHDDIIGQSRKEDSEYVTKVISERMMQPVVVRGRTMIIPNDYKFGAVDWAALKD